jgi:hypothetical protein
MPRVICPRCKEKVLIEGFSYGERAPCPECGRTIVLRKSKDGLSALQTARRSLQATASALRTASSAMFVLSLLGLLWFIYEVGSTFLQEKAPPVGAIAGLGKLPPFTLMTALIAGIILSVPKYVVIERGAKKMQDQTSYGWAMTAALLAILDVILLPFGIWALVILRRPETKATFPAHRND